MLADGGYTGKLFADGVYKVLGASVEIAKRNALPTFAVMPQRWVVECFLSGLKSAGECGKTARENSTPALHLSI